MPSGCFAKIKHALGPKVGTRGGIETNCKVVLPVNNTEDIFQCMLKNGSRRVGWGLLALFLYGM